MFCFVLFCFVLFCFVLFCFVLFLFFCFFCGQTDFWFQSYGQLKVDMPILTCIYFTFNWLTLTSEMHFVKFHPEVASCFLSRGKRKCAPLGMRLLWKYIRNYFLVYQLIPHFLLYLLNYIVQRIWRWNFGFAIRKIRAFIWYQKYTTSGWALGDENVIGIRAFKVREFPKNQMHFYIIPIHLCVKTLNLRFLANLLKNIVWWNNCNFWFIFKNL